MGNVTGRQLNVVGQGRRPYDNEMLVLFKMQRALFQRLVASPEHLQLLQRYWTVSFRRKHQIPGFVLVSELWREAGFSASNPAIDLNPTGELGLQCLVFFVETYPAETAMMRRCRGGYRFAKAAIAIVRALSLTLHLMDAKGNPGPFPVAATYFWQLFKQEKDVFLLFSLAFMAFEELFCEEVAANLWMKDQEACSMAVVDKLVAAVELKLTNELKKAPLELADLQDLCSNGRYIVDKMGENTRVAVIANWMSPDTGSGFVSRWSQHHTSKRKSMHEITKTWGTEKIHESFEGKVYRLKPRMPDIERYCSDSSQARGAICHDEATARRSEVAEKRKDDVSDQTVLLATQDLFAGLTTKSTIPPADSKNNKFDESLETPAPIA